MSRPGAPPDPYPLPPRRGGAWSEVLEPGERLLWQGRPHQGFLIRWSDVPMMAVGTAFLALSILFMAHAVTAWRAGDEAGGQMVGFGVALIVFGLYAVFGPPIGDMLRRQNSAYALTDRRALIETDFMGRGLTAVPITPDSPVALKPGNPPSAMFTIIRRRGFTLDRLLGAARGKGDELAGFDHIEEAEEVVAMMRRIQKEAE